MIRRTSSSGASFRKQWMMACTAISLRKSLAFADHSLGEIVESTSFVLHVDDLDFRGSFSFGCSSLRSSKKELMMVWCRIDGIKSRGSIYRRRIHNLDCCQWAPGPCKPFRLHAPGWTRMYVNTFAPRAWKATHWSWCNLTRLAL